MCSFCGHDTEDYWHRNDLMCPSLSSFQLEGEHMMACKRFPLHVWLPICYPEEWAALCAEAQELGITLPVLCS